MAIAEEVDGVEVWLDSSFSISGFVVQKGTDGEQGVDGVMVMAMSMSPPGMLQASGPSQSDGFFQIDGAKPGTYMLMAMGERHVPNMMQQTAVVSDSDVNDVLLGASNRACTWRGRCRLPERPTSPWTSPPRA